jgi:hypothetical protein
MRPLTRPSATLSPLKRGEGSHDETHLETLRPACGEKVVPQGGTG